MKKTMKRMAALLLVLLLVLALAACANGGTESVKPEPTAEPAPAPTAAPEKTPVPETPAPCEHQWTDATYASPKTCALCGETEGEPVPDYFTEHGLTILDEPPAEPLRLCYVTILASDPSIQTARDNGTCTVTQEVEPADEGYKIVRVHVTNVLPITNDESTDGQFGYSGLDAFYDYYTGRQVPSRSIVGDDAYEYGTVFTIDGVDYDVSFNVTSEFNKGDSWVLDENGVYVYTVTINLDYEFHVPEAYDGLVYGIIELFHYDEDTFQSVMNNNATEVSEDEDYAADSLNDDNHGDAVFIRLGTD